MVLIAIDTASKTTQKARRLLALSGSLLFKPITSQNSKGGSTINQYRINTCTTRNIALGRGLKTNITLGFVSCYICLSPSLISSFFVSQVWERARKHARTQTCNTKSCWERGYLSPMPSCNISRSTLTMVL